jgi:polar amino acid transport system substrate-binding protein
MLKLLTWIVSICAWSSGALAAEVIRAAYEDKSLPPYYTGTSEIIDADAPGVSVELMREAAKAAGVEIQFVRMPWVRCLKSLQRGDVDVIFNASFKEDRLEAGVYPMIGNKPDPARRIATISYVLYRLKGTGVAFTGTSITGLGDGPVGASSGYSVIDDLKKMGVKTEEAADIALNFRKLALRRIPAVAALEVQGEALLPDYPSIEKVSPPLVSKDYFVMASHQVYDTRREVVERLWAKIGEVREKRAAAIYAKYTR